MHLNTVPVAALADSGSARSLISSEVLSRVKGEFFANYLNWRKSLFGQFWKQTLNLLKSWELYNWI